MQDGLRLECFLPGTEPELPCWDPYKEKGAFEELIQVTAESGWIFLLDQGWWTGSLSDTSGYDFAFIPAEKEDIIWKSTAIIGMGENDC